MPISVINGIRIYSEWHGEGAPVVLVHGSWGDHHNRDPVVPGLARTFRTLTYDRRGHSQSERPAGQGSIEEDYHPGERRADGALRAQFEAGDLLGESHAGCARCLRCHGYTS